MTARIRLLFGVLALVAVGWIVVGSLGEPPDGGDRGITAHAEAPPVDAGEPRLEGTRTSPDTRRIQEEAAAALSNDGAPESDASPVTYTVVAIDIKTGDPIPHLDLRLETSEVSGLGTIRVATDAEGRLEVPVSSVTALVSESTLWHAAYASLDQVLRHRRLPCHAWFEVAGRVRWEGGNPPDLREIEIRCRRHEPSEGPDEQGHFRLRLPWTDGHRLTGSHPDAWTAELRLESPQEPERTIDAELVLRERSRPLLSGRVVDREGVPLAGALLHAHIPAKVSPPDRSFYARVRGADGRVRKRRIETPFHAATGRMNLSPRLPHHWISAATRTDDEGRFRFSLPAPAPVEVTVYAPGHAPVRRAAIDVRATGADVEIWVHRPVRNASALSFVRDGVPLEAAQVHIFELERRGARHYLFYDVTAETGSAIDTTWLDLGRRYRLFVEFGEEEPQTELTVEVVWSGQTEIPIP